MVIIFLERNCRSNIFTYSNKTVNISRKITIIFDKIDFLTTMQTALCKNQHVKMYISVTSLLIIKQSIIKIYYII